jgi:predicted NAD/FAD-dependent oxidoreductase
LDTALYIAALLKLPVLVYQGLGGRHPYNSDRHHTFILEGAREVQQQLQERGISYAFYLGRRPNKPSPLKSLAQRATLVITEDFPAPPFPQWTRQLARQVDTAVWTVDCACIIPMRLIQRAFDRAYAFRNHTQKDYERRLPQTWGDVVTVGQPFEGNYGFDAIDLAKADIAELCAQCEIDHTIPPVAHTPGGSTAGYARWEKFKRHGLKSYGRLRNDAAVVFPKGVSRMSAYLHHGHVSPFRIAADAALDGNDPNSYGGLLWCLGLFDRPFKPERPVIGTLRPRSTKDHAKRLNMAAYTAKIKGPVFGEPLKIGVIGSGLSGLFAAKTLKDHGHQVQVFEKTDRPGGRIATLTDSTYAFDTGAQYFTVRDDRLKRYVQSWLMDGFVQPWKGNVQVIKKGRLSDEKRVTERWVGIPGMDAIPARLAAAIEIELNVNVVSATKSNGRWRLIDHHNKNFGPYDAVIVAAPPPRATEFLRSSPKLLNRVAEVNMQPCLAVMAAFERPLDLPFDAAFIHQSPVRWAARNNSKPRRPEPECWVFHANAEWSQTAYNGKDDKAAGRSLLVSFFESIGRTFIEPRYRSTRYWQSAAAANPLNLGCLWDAELNIGLCGDWCQMSRVEGAALSGMAMAGKILGVAAKIQPNFQGSAQ